MDYREMSDDELAKALKDYAEHRSGEIADLTYAASLRISVLSAGGNKSEWISVSEREPQFPCLAIDKYHQAFIPVSTVYIDGRCYEGINFDFDTLGFLRGRKIIIDGEEAYIPPREIIAWMPLEPYEGEK